MSNEHIGRRQAIGIGKESTSGTPAAATAWMPKTGGSLKPVFESAVDNSAYGVIDENYGSQTVKNMTEVDIPGILCDGWTGNLFLGAMGMETLVYCATLATITGGTPARGDVVTHSSPAWNGTLKKIITIGAKDYFFFATNSGTLTDGKTITNGTWSAVITLIPAVKGHLFTRLNTNNHPSFTIYGSDPVGDNYAAYSMVDTLEVEFAVGDYAKFTSKFKGKKLVTASTQSPVYTADNPFLAKHAEVRFATNEAALNAATAGNVQRFKITIAKNVTDIQAFGDTDVASLHNQQFNIAGDLEAIYNSTTFQNYVANSTKKACRLSAINDDVAALFTASPTSDNIYPSIYIDMARLSFKEWSRSDDNNALVTQTMGFSGEFDVSTAMTLEILLLNSTAAAY